MTEKPTTACQRRFVAGLVILACMLLSACATSPLGRHQLKLFSPQKISQMGAMAFKQTAQKTPVSHDAALTQFVQCVAQAITAQTNYTANWNVKLFHSDQVNAFALPGGEIGVYSGLFKVAQNQAQLAAVLGHEVSHVIAGHANERMSDAALAQLGMQVAGASGAVGAGTMALLGMGAQVGILLPFSRAQESEADLMGLDLMSRAGFDPRQAVVLWQRMQHAGGKTPPELLSDHPSDARRIANIQARVPRDLPIYNSAVAAHGGPQCGPVPKGVSG